MAAADDDRRGRRGSSVYDRGERRALAFAKVLRRWRREQGTRALSEETLAYEVGLRVGRPVHRNDVRRVLNGEARLYHLTPEMAAAYVGAFEHTDPADVAEAFHAIGLLPPEVTREGLQLAVGMSRGNHSRVA